MSTTDMVADDDIDTEALQAQINMSMSLAEDLVSSWIKPEHRANLSKSTVDAQKLLDEQLRKPPRLGVGAPIPESSAATRDATRLKNQLMGKGKKRTSEDGISHKPGHQSEEEEEKRGGTIRKKMKLDPFAGKSKTAAKLDASSVTQSTRNLIAPHRQEDGRNSRTGGDDDDDDDDQEQGRDGLSTSSSLSANKIDEEGSFAKKKRWKHPLKEAMRSQEQGIPKSLLQMSQLIPCSDQSGSNQTCSVPPLGNAVSSFSFPIPGPFLPAMQPEVQQHGEWNVPEMITECPAPQGIERLCLTVPLLNLDGPPTQRDRSGKDDNPDNPQKKHRRRKKRKHPIKVDNKPLSYSS